MLHIDFLLFNIKLALHTHKHDIFVEGGKGLRCMYVTSLCVCVVADLCQHVQCQFGARCEAGECVCPTACGDSRTEPVCASDMRTYANECEMQKTACSLGQTLNVLFFGECRERPPAVGRISK